MDCNVFWHRGFSRRNSDSISLYLWVFRKPHDVTSSTLRVYSVSVVGPWLGTRSWSFSRSPWGPSQVPGSLLWSLLSTVASRSFEPLHKLNLGSAQHLVSCPWPTAEALLQGLSKGSRGLSVTQVPSASLPTSPLRPRHSAAAAPLASFVSWVSRVGCLLGLSLLTLPGLLFLCMIVAVSLGLSLFTLWTALPVYDCGHLLRSLPVHTLDCSSWVWLWLSPLVSPCSHSLDCSSCVWLWADSSPSAVLSAQNTIFSTLACPLLSAPVSPLPFCFFSTNCVLTSMFFIYVIVYYVLLASSS